MGETLVVRGGRQLYGVAETPAAKNSVLPLLAASLLCDGAVGGPAAGAHRPRGDRHARRLQAGPPAH